MSRTYAQAERISDGSSRYVHLVAVLVGDTASTAYVRQLSRSDVQLGVSVLAGRLIWTSAV